MKIEIHITVITNDIDKFISDCKDLNVKPIVIELQLQDKLSEYQVMTSSKFEGDTYHEELQSLTLKLQSLGYTIVRQKVEIYPDKNVPHVEHKYYESHLRLKFPKSYNVDEFQEDIKLMKFNVWHLSKNILKSDSEFFYQMVTYRAVANPALSNEYDFFVQMISLMELYLNIVEVEYDKVEIEECIYDSNMDLDSKWIKN